MKDPRIMDGFPIWIYLFDGLACPARPFTQKDENQVKGTVAHAVLNIKLFESCLSFQQDQCSQTRTKEQ